MSTQSEGKKQVVEWFVDGHFLKVKSSLCADGVGGGGGADRMITKTEASDTRFATIYELAQEAIRLCEQGHTDSAIRMLVVIQKISVPTAYVISSASLSDSLKR